MGPMKGVTGEMAIFMGERVCFTAFVTWVASGGGALLHHGATENFSRATAISPVTAAATDVNNVML